MMENLFFYLALFKWGLLAGLSYALASSLTAPYLLLQRNALFPHALTHLLLLALLSLSILSSYIPNTLHFLFLLFMTLLLTGLIYLLVRELNLYEDTATSLITHLSLGLALLLASLSSQYDATLLNYLFGSLITVEKKEAFEGLLVLIITLFTFWRQRGLWLTSGIDREVPGLNLRRGQLLLLLMITLQVIVGVKLMGALLVSSFFVFSPTLALKISPSFSPVVSLTALFNVAALISGFLLSMRLDIPFSASAIIFMGLYLVILFIARKK